jgi:hypothetical protein
MNPNGQMREVTHHSKSRRSVGDMAMNKCLVGYSVTAAAALLIGFFFFMKYGDLRVFACLLL